MGLRHFVKVSAIKQCIFSLLPNVSVAATNVCPRVLAPMHIIISKILFAAVDCGPLSAPMNGSSSGDLTVFPNSVLFNCDAGFIIGGSTKRKCQANGTWSGSQTVCNGRFQATSASMTVYLCVTVRAGRAGCTISNNSTH